MICTRMHSKLRTSLLLNTISCGLLTPITASSILYIHFFGFADSLVIGRGIAISTPHFDHSLPGTSSAEQCICASKLLENPVRQDVDTEMSLPLVFAKVGCDFNIEVHARGIYPDLLFKPPSSTPQNMEGLLLRVASDQKWCDLSASKTMKRMKE